MENHLPVVYIVDSAGVFLPLQDEIFPDKEHFGRIFRNNARMSAMGITQIAAVMGACVAGGAYLPLDPALPHQRLLDLLQDAQPSFVLTDSAGRSALGQEVCSSYAGLSLDDALTLEPVQLNPKVPELKSSHLAYVIYTSGSTGKPKGVLVEHRNALNLVYWTTEALKLGSQSRVLQFASLSFDASVW